MQEATIIVFSKSTEDSFGRLFGNRISILKYISMHGIGTEDEWHIGPYVGVGQKSRP
jgi:hypothetical protein|tara:strand:- start:230 stop:400 length:171 start_codon:yes stop_codon:yes gene_type:complete